MGRNFATAVILGAIETLSACTIKEAPTSRVRSESTTGGVAILPMPAQAASLANSKRVGVECRSVVVKAADFAECWGPNTECRIYSLMADSGDAEVVGCAPGPLELDISARLYHKRLAVQAREIQGRDPCIEFELVLEKALIPNPPEKPVPAGTVVATVAVGANGAGIFRFESGLKSVTGASAMKGYRDGALRCEQFVTPSEPSK
jgi:hypothetical protein